MNVYLELEVDNNFRFATTLEKRYQTLKDNRLATKKKRKGTLSGMLICLNCT